MKAVRISERRPRKRRTALRGTYTIVPCDAILEDFVAFKQPTYAQPEKQLQHIRDIFLCKFLLLILSKFHLPNPHE